MQTAPKIHNQYSTNKSNTNTNTNRPTMQGYQLKQIKMNADIE